MLTLFKKFERVRYLRFTLTIIVEGLWLNSEETTDEEVIEKLSIELWLQILPGLETKIYKRLRRISANTGDFTE